MGYNINVSLAARKSALEQIYSESTLPRVQNLDYVEEWGGPSSGVRLQKMANTIASLARNAQRNPKDLSRAIAVWKRDLDWLRRTLYRPRRHNFDWPNSSFESPRHPTPSKAPWSFSEPHLRRRRRLGRGRW